MKPFTIFHFIVSPKIPVRVDVNSQETVVILMFRTADS